MSREQQKAYDKALRRIEECHQQGRRGTGLDLQRLGLTALPPEVSQLSTLTRLDLSDNQLTSLPPQLGQLSALTVLDLSSNRFTSLPPEIGQLSALTGLYLHNNQLTSLPPQLGQLTALTELVLLHNQLTSLPRQLGQLAALRILFVQGNQLTSLPPEIGQLSALTQLVLSHNQLTSLPPQLGQLAALTELYLHGNPALNLPVEVLGPRYGDTTAAIPRVWPAVILDYYFAHQGRAAVSGTQPLNEAKVLVLGESEVGKSSLILALTEGKLRQPLDKTHGIVQRPWSLSLRAGHLAAVDDKGEETLRLNLWDFGGQEVYHSTHAFFLTCRAVYLLVADARANDRQNNLEYWLQMAVSFGAGAPIWVVVNKCDQHGAGPDEHALRRKFPGIRGFLRTSCWTGVGLETLRETLAAEALALEGVRQQMNKVWLGIKHRLEKMKQDTLSLEDYVRLCAEAGEREAGRAEKLLDLWDKLGTVRYFPTRAEDPPAMRDTAILNPEWVTKAVYAVLDDAEVRAAGGLATENDFERILRAGGGVAARHLMIEQVMRRFDLLYDTPEHLPQHRMLVPQLLPEREPAFEWPGAGTLCFVYRYPVLPAALVPGFIARRHRLLAKSPGPWRHGCVLEFPSTARVRIIGDAEKKEVSLAVTGEPLAARDALDAVRGTFEEMHGAIQGLVVEELIPVPGHPGAALIGYRLLRALEFNGRPTHFAQGATASEIIEVDVREALNAVRGPTKAEAEARTINMYGDVVQGSKTMNNDDHSIRIGGNVTNAQVGQVLTSCRNQIGQAEGEKRELLESLHREVERLIAALPEERRDKAQKVAGYLNTVVTEAVSKEPERTVYLPSAKGLLEASQWVKGFTGNIAGTIGELGKLLWPGGE